MIARTTAVSEQEPIILSENRMRLLTAQEKLDDAKKELQIAQETMAINPNHLKRIKAIISNKRLTLEQQKAKLKQITDPKAHLAIDEIIKLLLELEGMQT